MIFIVVRVIALPATFVLLWWIGLQLLAGLPQLARVEPVSAGVAVWAHIGGFGAGLLLSRVFQNRQLLSAHS